uniref:Uncharacterized protein n=1 Tax=Solanum lycopersicum TaxID=4081 RepID=A0A3Q7JCV1_SOLLC
MLHSIYLVSFGFDVKLEMPVVFSACRRTKVVSDFLLLNGFSVTLETSDISSERLHQIIRFIHECKESDVLGDHKARSYGHGKNVPKRLCSRHRLGILVPKLEHHDQYLKNAAVAPKINFIST